MPILTEKFNGIKDIEDVYSVDDEQIEYFSETLTYGSTYLSISNAYEVVTLFEHNEFNVDQDSEHRID